MKVTPMEAEAEVSFVAGIFIFDYVVVVICPVRSGTESYIHPFEYVGIETDFEIRKDSGFIWNLPEGASKIEQN